MSPRGGAVRDWSLYAATQGLSARPDASWQQSDAPFAAVRKNKLPNTLRASGSSSMCRSSSPARRFQQRVWQELVRIALLARRSRMPNSPSASASRPLRAAVGPPNGRNPISIIVPCHRVIGADGKLTGYAGGVDKKQCCSPRERRATQRKPGFILFDAAGLSPTTPGPPLGGTCPRLNSESRRSARFLWRQAAPRASGITRH